MGIKTNAGGFTEATLEAANGAELHARLSNDMDDFLITMEKDTGWYFDIPALEEAISFFEALKAELKRRNKEERDKHL